MHAYLDELIDSDGLPKETIRRCLEHPDRVVPSFLTLLQQYANDPYLNDERADALFFVIHILGELGEKGAFAPLIDFLSGDQRRVENILGDAVTENLAQILISVFDGQTDRLYQVMNNPVVDEFVRYSTFMAWVHAVASGQIGREEAERYLSDCFETLQPQGKSHVWLLGSIVSPTLDLSTLSRSSGKPLTPVGCRIGQSIGKTSRIFSRPG